MKLTITGTASMVPTKERNVQGMVLEYNGELILFDCGEGTQRQMNIAGLNRAKVKKILITHWHGDHISGLVGLLQTIGNIPNPPEIKIYGPVNTKERLHHLIDAIVWENHLDLDVIELTPGKSEMFYENREYELWCAPLEHSCPCLAFRFQEKDRLKMNAEKLKEFGVYGSNTGKLQRGETVKVKGKEITPDMVSTVRKGKSFALVSDTQPCQGALDISQDADVLLIETTFDTSHEELARQRKHMSVPDVCNIAQRANVKRLLLTHFSQRYKSVKHIQEEAQALFPNSEAAFDFMTVKF